MFCTELDLNPQKKKHSRTNDDNWSKCVRLWLNLPNLSSEDQDESRRDQEKLDLVELLEAVTYLVCQDNHVVPDTFYKVHVTRVSKKKTKILL